MPMPRDDAAINTLHKQPKMPDFVTCSQCKTLYNRFIHPCCPHCGSPSAHAQTQMGEKV